jgi:Tfp pilus assembly protein PilF
MSLMNDALRKKRSEKKQPSGADFLKTDPEPKTKSNIKTYGLIIIGLLICTIGGYFGYEYYSLSRPIAPPQPAPLIAATTPPPSQTEQTSELKSNQETEPVEPDQAVAPALQNKETTITEVESKAQARPLSETGLPKSAPAEKKETKPQAPVPNQKKATEASRQANSAPTPVIEPDGPPPKPQSPKLSLPPKAATTMEPVPAPEASEPVAERFYRKGLSYHRQNDLEKAIPMYLAARKKDPQHTATSFNLASAYIQTGAFTEAQNILSDLHLKYPDNPEVLLNMAVVELGLDRPQQALSFLDRAEMKFAQPRYEVLFHQGTAHSRLGNFSEALDFYQKAARFAPEKARLSLNIAIAYDNLTQYDQAIAYYQMFLDQYQNLDAAERHEIEKRVRELKAYLAQKQGAATQ